MIMLEKVKNLFNGLEAVDLSQYKLEIYDWGDMWIFSIEKSKETAPLKVMIKSVNNEYCLCWYDKNTELTAAEYYDLASQLARIKAKKVEDDLNNVLNYLSE